MNTCNSIGQTFFVGNIDYLSPELLAVGSFTLRLDPSSEVKARTHVVNTW
jgi:hypothetical protein